MTLLSPTTSLNHEVPVKEGVTQMDFHAFVHIYRQNSDIIAISQPPVEPERKR
jgi:hypothetical protein